MSSSSYAGGVTGGPARDYSDYFVLPAASSQRQLWFLCQLDAASNAAYNVVSAVRLTGRLNQVLLQRALNEVVARHESLRTGIGLVDGEPRQVVVPDTLVSLPVVTGDVQSLAAEQAAIPFTLDEPPLLRVVLVREAPELHTLITVIHHVACDGWSTEIFYRDLALAYHRLASGDLTSLDELPIQYADYVAWQQESLSGEPMRDLVTHWRAALSGVTPLDLPVDRPRDSVRKMAGGRLEAPLPDVSVLAERFSATPFMVLLAAFKVALARITGQADVAVGTPVAGRHHPDSEELIGFFANTLVLRTRLSLGESFGAAVGAVRDTCLAAFQHQQMPFDRLVEEMRLPRVLDRNPLFDVMFSMQEKPAVDVELPSLTMSPVELTSTSAKFDLWLTVVPHGIRLDYDADLYDRETASSVLHTCLAVLDEVLRDPDVVCAGLPEASADDMAQISYWAEGPSVEVPGGTVLDLITDPDVVARATALSELLRDEGIGGHVVTTPPVASLDLAVIALAVFEIGGSLVYGERHTRDGAFVQAGKVGWVVTTGPRFDESDAVVPEPDGLAWNGFTHRELVAAIFALRERLGTAELGLLGDAPDLVDVLLPLVFGTQPVFGDTAPVIIANAVTWRRMLTDGWTPPAGATIVCRGEVVAEDVLTMLRRTGAEVLAARTNAASASPLGLASTGIGTPLAATTRSLVDGTGAPAALGTVGELQVNGRNTEERYRYTRTGELHFVGYTDDRIVAGDHTVDPHRVEAVLAGIEGVRSAAVVTGHVGAETRLVGWLVAEGAKTSKREQDELAATVRSKALQQLQPHEVPVAFGVLPELPRLTDGSLDRAALAALPGQALLGAVDDTPPRNRIERQIVAIFKDVLPIPEFGVHADFFGLGGHSMLAAKVIGRVRDQLGVLVPVRDFFKRPTAAGLAEAVAALEQEKTPKKDKTSAVRGQLEGMTDKEIEQLLRQLG